jgi:elongation factor G
LKAHDVDKIRNLALLGHQHTGKTTFLESMLFETKQVPRQGRVDDGNSNLDFTPEEADRKLSIQSALAYAEWKGHKINFVDTPGYDDFVVEQLGALAAVECGLVFVKADAHVEVGTEKAWRELDAFDRARIVVVNQMDKEHADFERALSEMRKRLSHKVAALHLPIGRGDKFEGWVDVVQEKAYRFAGGGAADVPAAMADQVAAAREALMNAAAETDDALTEKFLETGVLAPEEFRTGLVRAVAQGAVYPVVVAAAGRGFGIAPILDAIVELAPSPATIPVRGTKGVGGEAVERRAAASEPVAALAFKAVSEGNVGDYTYVRVFSGKLVPGLELVNANTGQSERTGPVYALNGKLRTDLEALSAGDIGAAVKLKHTHTGNTLCDPKAPLVLPFPATPEPLVSVAIRAKGKGDEDKLSSGLQRLHEEDPGFRVTVTSDTHQTLLHGQGDTHLAIVLGKLKRKFGVDVETEPPRTPYRETIKGHADERYRHKKQTGGRGQFGEVHLKVEPLPRGGNFEFVDAVVGGVIPGKFLPAVEKGVREAMAEGVVAGYPFVDVRVTVDDGKDHAVDSSEAAFKIAGSQAFKLAIPKAKPVLLEPIYKIEVRLPEDYMGDVMGDLSSRRGRIQGMDQKDGLQVVRAEVPLAELYSYATGLRSLTQGRASHTRTFSHYEEVPREVADAIIAEHKAHAQQQQHESH